MIKKISPNKLQSLIKLDIEKDTEKNAFDLWKALFPVMVQSGNFIPFDEFYTTETKTDRRSIKELENEVQEIRNKFKEMG